MLSGLLVFWKMRDESTIEKSERITFRDLGKVLKMPAIWIIGLVTFCNYVFTLSLYYFTPYGTSILGMSVTFGAPRPTAPPPRGRGRSRGPLRGDPTRPRRSTSPR